MQSMWFRSESTAERGARGGGRKTGGGKREGGIRERRDTLRHSFTSRPLFSRCPRAFGWGKDCRANASAREHVVRMICIKKKTFFGRSRADDMYLFQWLQAVAPRSHPD